MAIHCGGMSSMVNLKARVMVDLMVTLRPKETFPRCRKTQHMAAIGSEELRKKVLEQIRPVSKDLFSEAT